MIPQLHQTNRLLRNCFIMIASTGVLGGLTACTATLPKQAWSAEYRDHAVAADHHLASEAGAEILAAGGNAVDAAVATSFTLSVVRPFSCGLGGGGFMIISLPETDSRAEVRTVLNYRETSPAAVGPTYYTESGASSLYGATAAAVPGTVAGLLDAHAKYGVLSREAVLAPAIRIAQAGFRADAALVGAATKKIDYFEEHPDQKERFEFVWKRYCREGRIAVGDLITNPEQADALRLISEHGADAFYRGPIADAIIRAIKNDGGVMTTDDLASYSIVESKPLEFAYLGRQVLTMPPPSSGGIALAQIAGIYDRLLAEHADELRTVELTSHLYAEASAHAFADRAEYLADAAFVDVPIDWLISDERLNQLAASVDPTRTKPPESYGSTSPPRDDSGTSHLSIIDAEGGAVACTETINTSFGSMLAVPEFGFCLNNEMDDFTTIPGKANAYGLIQSNKNLPAPGKRPLSSMTPTIVIDSNGHPLLVSGASGGPRIISAVAQTLLEPNPLGYAQSLAHPRLHHQWLPFLLQHEAEVPGEIHIALEGMGHKLRSRAGVGVAQTIRLVQTDHGPRWRAQSDPRKGGRPAGK